jgi:hypothetical protein
MHVTACVITLQLYGIDSLKDKRRVIKSILTRLPHHFNVATAEIDNHDTWQTSVICIVSVGNDPGYLHGLMEKAVSWIEVNQRAAVVEHYTIESL